MQFNEAALHWLNDLSAQGILMTDSELNIRSCKHGAAWIKAAGGLVFTEAEESCVVYGMPASVLEAGFSDKSIRLDQMAEAILEVV